MELHLGAPQIIYLILSLAGLVGSALEHGKPRKPGNFFSAMLAAIIVWPLLYWGGFFGK